MTPNGGGKQSGFIQTRRDYLYNLITNEEDAQVCTDIEKDACQWVPANFFIIIIAQCLTKLSDALANTKVVLPWMLNSVGVPAFFVGLLVPVRESGSMIPQLLIGGLVRHFELRKWFFVAGSVLQGLAILALAWSLWIFEGTVAGIISIALLLLFSLARGLCSVASKDVLGKTIPRGRRGRLNGLSASIAGCIMLFVAAGLLIDADLFQDNAIGLLVAAGISWLVAAWVYSRIIEYSGATEGGGNALLEAWTNLALLKNDTDFRRFVVVRALMMSSGLAAPYLVLAATRQSDDPSVTGLGVFMAVSAIASLVGGFFWGKYSDVSSRKVLLITAIMASLICGFSGLLSLLSIGQTIWIYTALFFLLTLTHQGVRLGRKTYVVDLASGNRRTDYVAVSNTVIGLLLLLFGLFGALTAQLSIGLVLLLFSMTSVVAAIIAVRLPEV